MANRIGKYKVSAKESLFSVIDGGTIGGRMVWGSETLTEDGDAANPDIPLTILDHISGWYGGRTDENIHIIDC